MKGLILLAVLLCALANASTISYTYDPAGRLVGLNYGGDTNTVLSYDNNGNLVAQSTFVSANPDLSISQLATPASVVVGLTVQYAVTVFNNSLVGATAVNVTNTLPANGTFVSSSATQGSIARSGNVLVWNVGTLAGGTSASMEFSERADSLGALTNAAIVGAAQADPEASNNSSTILTTVVGPLQLMASVSSSGLIVSWPLDGGGSFSIQHTDSLVSPIAWVPDPISPSISGNFFYIAAPSTNLTRFYRLVSSP